MTASAGLILTPMHSVIHIYLALRLDPGGSGLTSGRWDGTLPLVTISGATCIC